MPVNGAGEDDEDDENPRPARPYRDAAGASATPTLRRGNARILSALATISAAHGEDATSRRLRERADVAKDDERERALEKAEAARRTAHAAFLNGEWASAEAQYATSLSIHEELGEPILADLASIATSQRMRGAWGVSELVFRRATRLDQGSLPRDTPAMIVHELAVLHVHLGRVESARSLLLRALGAELDRGVEAHGSEQVARLRHALAECLLDLGDVRTAQAHLTKVVSVRTAMSPDHPALASTLATVGRIEHAEGKLSAAEQTFARALERLPPGPPSAQTLVVVASLFVDQQRPADAEALLDQAMRDLQHVVGDAHPTLCRALRVRERLFRASERHASAESDARRLARIVEGMDALTARNYECGVGS